MQQCQLRAAPAAKDVLDAIEVLRGMNSDNARKVPADAPTEFIKPRWQKLVMTDTGIDRRYYELCALSELKNALRSGDIWVQGSRQFKDFEDYLVPPAKFASLKQASELPLAVATDCNRYLNDRLTLLETQLATVNRMALANELPDAIICANNYIALGCVDAAAKKGLRIPKDIGIMAFDNFPFSQIIEPPLTVVDINVRDMGTQAAKFLTDIMRHPNMQIQTYITTSNVIVRGSTR